MVGESHYQPALRHVAAGKSVAPRSLDNAIPALAVLVPEPDNPYDSTAVRVDLLDKAGVPHKVGYLARDLAAECHPRLARLGNGNELGCCPARIMGGGRRSYGVHLHLLAPEITPVRNEMGDGVLLDADRNVTVTKESDHQEALAPYAPGPGQSRTSVFVKLSPIAVATGKHSGKLAIEVQLDGRRVGETTTYQAERYKDIITAVLDEGSQPFCEGLVRSSHKGLEIELFLPPLRNDLSGFVD
ncbi:MAG: HIRAN domain-containing protein [Stackebrandtia sp.]